MNTHRIHVGTPREIDDARQHAGGIVNNCSGFGARDQRAVRTIGAIGERLARRAQPSGFGRGDQLRAREAEENQRRIDRLRRARDGVSDTPVANRDVVERAVRFHMLQPKAGIGGDLGQRFDLPNHEICNLIGRQLQIAPAEVLAIVEARMSADGNAVIACKPDRVAHHRAITGV